MASFDTVQARRLRRGSGVTLWPALLLLPACAGSAPADDSLGEGLAAEPLSSAQTCVSLRRSGAAGTVLDTGIVNKTPPKNYGAAQTLPVGTSGGVANQTLLQFDLAPITGGPNTSATIVTAAVNLARGPVAPTGPGTIEVHNVLSPWTEAGVTWQSFAGAYAPTPLTTFSNQPLFPSFALTSLVQSWVAGTTPNHGVLLVDPGPNVVSLWSSESTSFYARPELNVCFTAACNPGFADCNNLALDGCEVNVASSAVELRRVRRAVPERRVHGRRLRPADLQRRRPEPG